MTDVENRGGPSFEDIEVRSMPVLVCAVCGLGECGHQAGLKVVKPQPEATVEVDHPLGGSLDYDNGITS